MKFLFRSHKQSKAATAASGTTCSTGLVSSSSSTRNPSTPLDADAQLTAAVNHTGEEEDMCIPVGNSGTMHKRHKKKKQQKRRQSLVDMEVPLARSSTVTSTASTALTSTICSPGATETPMSSSGSTGITCAIEKTRTAAAASRGKRLLGKPRNQRPSDVSSSLTSRTSIASSLGIGRNSSIMSMVPTPTASAASAAAGAQPCLFGSHRSLDTDQGIACNAPAPFVCVLQEEGEEEDDPGRTSTGHSSVPREEDTTSHVHAHAPTQPLEETPAALPVTFLKTNVTDSVKDHAFQLVPNIHKELGMLHRDFNCVKEAIDHFSSLLRCCSSSSGTWPKPILSIDVELPGNLHAGRTIFSHPLLVEAIETFFVVITTPHDTLPQEFHATTLQTSASSACGTSGNSVRCSKMRGNYVYTRLRILDPMTGCDLVPCVDDRRLSLASVLQAMMDALAMVCPEQPLPRYLTNLLEEEQATNHAAALYHRRNDLNYYSGANTPTIIDEYDFCHHLHHHHHYNHHYNRHHSHHHHGHDVMNTPRAPMAVFGLEHTALGEVVLAELEGVLSTQCAWVIPQLSGSSMTATATTKAGLSSFAPPPALARASSEKSASSATSNATCCDPPDRQAVIFVSYDPQRLSYCTLAKFVVQQHALGRLGRPSCLTFYYTSHEQQVAAQMHTRAHYRQLMAQVDPTNPAQHYYSNNNINGNNNGKAGNSNETIRIVALQQQDHKGETLHSNNHRRHHKKKRADGHSSASSTGSSSEDSLFAEEEIVNRKNNSKNKTHPGYKVPDYDDVVEHAAAKAAAEAVAAKETAPRYSFVLKTMCGASLQLQCSKPALRESHLRFVPLTPYQATRANQLVYQGKFHLAMKLLSPRQGMVLMHALRSGKPKKCIACCSHPSVPQPAAAVKKPGPCSTSTKTPATKSPRSSAKLTPTKKSNGTTSAPSKAAEGTKSTKKTRSPGASKTTSADGAPPKSNETNGEDDTQAAPKRRPSTANPKPSGDDSSKSPAANRRLRRSSTTDRMGSVRRFPKQTQRMSLNTEAMRKSANAAAESLQHQLKSTPQVDKDALAATTDLDPAPPVATIDTSSSSSAEPCGTAASAAANKSNIVYNDVVDVPILEAWKAFVVLPEGWTIMDGEDDDDSYFLGLNDVYSQDLNFDRAYYTSDDNDSLGS